MSPRGSVVAAADVPARRAAGDTAAVRATIDCAELQQRVLHCAAGRTAERETGAAEEVLYVVSGAGTVVVRDDAHAVDGDAGVYVAPGERYAIDNPGPGELTLVAVRLPGPDHADGPRSAAVSRAEQETGIATADRTFRIVTDPATGCRSATQFVGLIPPGRAPEHYHRYDEVVYVLHGEGVLHLPDGDAPVRPRSCIHLPRQVPHSLENAGTTPMHVLGVFRPAGSPAEAYLTDGSPVARSTRSTVGHHRKDLR